MTLYARLVDGAISDYPLNEQDLRIAHPNTSFPIPFQTPGGYVSVIEVERPTITHLEDLVEGAPSFSDGVWYQTWTVVEATAEQIAARTAAEAENVRDLRNQQLAASDWTQLPDSPVSATAWAQYRQRLRDITAQAGFPWSVAWPETP